MNDPSRFAGGPDDVDPAGEPVTEEREFAERLANDPALLSRAKLACATIKAHGWEDLDFHDLISFFMAGCPSIDEWPPVKVAEMVFEYMDFSGESGTPEEFVKSVLEA